MYRGAAHHCVLTSCTAFGALEFLELQYKVITHLMITVESLFNEHLGPTIFYLSVFSTFRSKTNFSNFLNPGHFKSVLLCIIVIWCMMSYWQHYVCVTQVDWPCNIVITDQSLMKYNKVLTHLLFKSDILYTRCLSS